MALKRIPAIAALIVFVLHLIGNPHYGFFRDELYFIICGFHPAWGYVDQPPVVPLLAAGSQLFGHSLFFLRAVPALFAAGGVYVTCLLVVELGGGTFAQIVAALVFFFCNVLLSFGTKVSPDMVGLWLWPLMALYLLRLVKGADPRWWLAIGAALGICIESKYMVLFFAVALLGGLALTPERRILRSKWFAAAIGIALLIALPNALWQAVHHFPMWELLRAGQTGKNVIAGPVLFIIQNILITNLLLAIVWIIGLVALLRGAATRFLGLAYIILIALTIALHGKDYYPGDVYPILIAAGAATIAAWTKRSVALRTVVTIAIVVSGLIFLPFSLPVLGETQMVAYSQSIREILHLKRSTLATEHDRPTPLPSDWADMHGWPELAATVARVYRSLPPAQRAQAAIVANNYGEAAAIDFFGEADHLPPVISGHNNYWLWGTHGYSGSVVIDVNGDCGAAAHLFRNSRRAATFANPWGQSYEQNIPIMVCTDPRANLSSYWAQMRTYR